MNDEYWSRKKGGVEGAARDAQETRMSVQVVVSLSADRDVDLHAEFIHLTFDRSTPGRIEVVRLLPAARDIPAAFGEPERS